MATAIKIPDMGTTVDRVTLLNWLKKEGDTVKRGDVLCEIETDKAVNDLESIAQGVLLKIMVDEGSEIDQGSIIAYVGTSGEQIPSEENKSAPVEVPVGAPQSKDETSSNRKQPKVAALVANVAKKYGVDLATVDGSGSGGRITRDDVLRAKDSVGAPAGSAATKTEPFPANQIVVARRVSRSQREIPPVVIDCEVDMTIVIKKREEISGSASKKICYDAFFVKALATVMKEYSHLKVHLDGETVIQSEAIGIGVAIGIGNDLFIPVIKNPETKSISDIDAEIRVLAKKAEANNFSVDDLNGATMTISNLGMFPVKRFTAIIPPDQMGILSVGAIKDTPVVKDGALSIGPIAGITLSVDHRLINGREAGEMVARLKEVIELL
jgi:pyruvate dehydrogenase E2 component (dihydrolipoamide acetyltransferase)